MADQVWRITVDEHNCLGSGMCSGTAPRYFRLAGEVARPVHDAVAPDDLVLDAAEACPAEAITVEDEGSGKVLVPEA